jgi:hypothetical protein
MFINLLLNLGFAHLFGTLFSLANLGVSDLLVKLVLALLLFLHLTSTSKPSNLNSHSLVPLVHLHFLKF